MAVIGWLCWSCPGFAQEAPEAPLPPPKPSPATPVNIPKPQLYNLAWDFLNKVGKSLKTADLMMSGAGKIELAQRLSGTEIPEGEPLLLHGIVGVNKLDLKQEVYAVKQGTRLMVSLGEFTNAADLVISVNPAEKRAEGWFIREDQTFFLDAQKGEVTIMGKTEKLDPLDISLMDNDLLVSSTLLEKWFGLDIQYDFARLNMNIRTSQLLPVETKYLRSKINVGNDFNVGPSKLPRLDEPYQIISKPNIDVNLNTGRRTTPGRPATTSGAWSALAAGDLLGYDAQAYASGNKLVPLSEVRLTLNRTDENSELLGPLRASFYQIGDVGTISLPLIDPGAQEQGISLTNKPINASTQSTTEIRGNALPDWDVELYNNDTFIDIQHIDGRGLYEFRDVILYAGNNVFKILFYGPQGEIREETRNILVDPSKFEHNKGYYSLSATRQLTTTWMEAPIPGPDVGKPHLVGSYAYGFGNLGTANVGLRLRSDNGEQRAFLQSGWATHLFDTFLNADSGYDLETLQYGTTFGARRNFGPQRVSLRFSTNSENFDPNNTLNPDVSKYFAQADINGPLLIDEFLSIKKLAYGTQARYGVTHDGNESFGFSSGLTGRYKAINLTSGFAYRSTTTAPDTLEWNIRSRGFYKGDQWTLGTSSFLLPERKPGPIEGEYMHNFNDRLSAKADFRHLITPAFTEAGLALNWRTDKAVISPKISGDSDKRLNMSVNVRFGLTPEPYSGGYQMVGKTMTSVGGVAARIFLDKNGDGIYNEGEELLPDTNIKAAQAYRKATSDERGIAFINDLPAGVVTDVSIDPLTLPDISFLSLFNGLSVRPRPGIISQIEFPIVVGGEMDGSGYLSNGPSSKIPARNLMLTLTAPDGRVEKAAQTAYDGYYSMLDIRPGVYYLSVDPEKSEGKSYMIPEKVVFDPKGTTMYSNNPALVKGYDIPFRFRSRDKMEIPFTRSRVEKPEDSAGEEVLLHLGPYHTRLALTFSWYRFKIRSMPWGSYFSLATPIPKIEADPKTGEMYLVLKAQQTFGLREAALACQTLQDLKFDCSVEVVTHYEFDRTPSAAVKKSSEKKG